MVFRGVNNIGGIWRSGVANDVDCLLQCQQNVATCAGVDYSYGGSTGCYFHRYDTECNPLSATLFSNNHFRLATTKCK